MINSFYTIKDLSDEYIDQVMVLSGNEGWNQTGSDWRFIIENPSVIALAALHKGLVIGTATAIIYNDKVAWIGMVLVEKSFRHQGIGRMLLTNILGRLKDIDSVKLDATPAGYPLYRKLGFVDEYKLFRMINPATGNIPEPSANITSINPIEFREILRLDRDIFGVDRSEVLRKYFSIYPSKAFLLKENGQTAGYILGRDGRKFNYLGPLCTSSGRFAKDLLSRALQDCSNKPAALDVPESKIDFINWLKSTGFETERQFTRMYLKGNACQGKTDNQFLIGGPEFG